jgi:hypothetical protein
VIWQYISDDGFTDFKTGLIGLGRTVDGDGHQPGERWDGRFVTRSVSPC